MLCMFDTGFINLTNRYLTWKIQNFHTIPLIVGSEIRSPQFVYGNSSYTLVIWPRGQKGTGSEEWFGICLYKYDARGSDDSVQFSIVNALGTVKTCTVRCSENNIFMESKFIEWSDFRTIMHKIAPNGCLTIICRLPMERHIEERSQNENITPMLTRPMNDPPVKYQSGDYQSAETMPMITSVKFGNPEVRVSSFAVPGIDYDSPSTINSFFSTSSRENSFEFVPESVETLNTDFKMPHNVPNATNPENTIWKYFTRGFSRDSTKNPPDVVLDPVGDISENTITEPVRDSAAVLQENDKSSLTSSSSESSSVDSVRVSSNVHLPGNTPTSSVDGEDSQRTSQKQVLPNNSTFQDFVASSAASSCLKSQQSSARYPKGLKILSQHLKNIYLERKDFDLTIIMEGKEFKVLRSILKSRSPIFAQMLSQDTSNIISINPFDACDSSIFHDFLLYIYSGEIENLSHKNVYGLYSAACKFEMPDLKEQCVRFLKLSLSIDTVTDILRLVNNESDLLEIAIFFLAKNMEIIMETDEWKQFMTKEPNLAVKYHLKALSIGFKKTIT